MKSEQIKRFLLVSLAVFAFSCANKSLIRDHEYNLVYHALSDKNPQQALQLFPTKESGGFITSFEKAWIRFWDGEKFSDEQVKNIQKLSDQIEMRKFTRVSYETAVFFVGETEDGYIPSEHEIISLHLFLAMIYLDRQQYESAHVELKRAVEFLVNNPDGKEVTFEDPAIRLWLAALWEALGNRNASDVDLRKTMELSGQRSMQKLIDNRQRKIKLIMNGLGPRTRWSNSDLSFTFDYKLLPNDSDKKYIFSTREWYEWHKKRNTDIRERLVKSHYMAESLSSQAAGATQKTFGYAFTSTFYVTAVAIVAGTVYLMAVVASEGGNADALEGLAYLGGGAAAWVWNEANDINKSVARNVEIQEEKRRENLKTYRMIRFLPDSIEYVDENLTNASSQKTYKGFRKTLGQGNNQVEFIWNTE
jgi:hypothetical protein